VAKPTLIDVAREAGVHPGTASRALNPALPGRVAEETAAKVRAAAARLGYQPDLSGQSLRTRRTRTIGVLVPDLSNPTFPRIVRGIEEQLRSVGYEAIIASTDNDQGRETTVLDVLRARNCDGFVVATAFRRDENVAGLVADGTPVVLINRLVDGLEVPAVVSDDAGGVRAAVRYLWERGHRAIAYVAGPRSLSITTLRVSAFKAELRRLGVARPGSRVIHASGYTIEGGRDAAAEMLKRLSGDVTAVVAGNDMMAIGCLAFLAEHGVSCPADISLVGFNDMPLSAHLRPALTTIAIPQFELGVEAARLLVERIVDPTGPARTVVLPTEVVERESVVSIGPGR